MRSLGTAIQTLRDEIADVQEIRRITYRSMPRVIRERGRRSEIAGGISKNSLAIPTCVTRLISATIVSLSNNKRNGSRRLISLAAHRCQNKCGLPAFFHRVDEPPREFSYLKSISCARLMLLLSTCSTFLKSIKISAKKISSKKNNQRDKEKTHFTVSPIPALTRHTDIRG